MGANPKSADMARAVEVENAEGAGPFVFLCDHASNFFPSPYDEALGLAESEKSAHIAWDPGALGVAQNLSRSLNAPLVYSTVSRLIIDCNREEGRDDLIPSLSETTQIAGNRDVSASEKEFRLNLAHRPFHEATERLLNLRRAQGLPTAVVSVHSYTPVYKGVQRPWEIGLIYETDRRLADAMLGELRALDDLTVGDNQPYAPSDGVYYTVRRHGQDRQLPCLMIEIRNDEITTPDAEARWASLLAPMLCKAVEDMVATGKGGADVSCL